MAKFGDFQKFAERVEKMAPRRKPVKTRAKMTGTLFAKRNQRIAIREACLRQVSVVILYKKITDNEIKRYEVIPLSYRYRRTKYGLRKVLFLQDVREKKQIKYFVLRNVIKVAITNRKVRPDWSVEIF